MSVTASFSCWSLVLASALKKSPMFLLTVNFSLYSKVHGLRSEQSNGLIQSRHEHARRRGGRNGGSSSHWTEAESEEEAEEQTVDTDSLGPKNFAGGWSVLHHHHVPEHSRLALDSIFNSQVSCVGTVSVPCSDVVVGT